MSVTYTPPEGAIDWRQVAIAALRTAADKWESGEVGWFGNGQPGFVNKHARCAVLALVAATGSGPTPGELMALAAIVAVSPDIPDKPLLAGEEETAHRVINWNDDLVQGGLPTVIARFRAAADYLEAQGS